MISLAVFSIVGEGVFHGDSVFLTRFIICIVSIIIALLTCLHSIISVLVRKKDIPYPPLISLCYFLIALGTIIFLVISVPFTLNDSIDEATPESLFYYQRIVGCCYVHISTQNCGCYHEKCSDCEKVLMPIINIAFITVIVSTVILCIILVVSIFIHHLNNIQFAYRYIYTHYFSNSNYNNLQ